MNPLTGVLGEAWALYKRHASHFLLIALAISLVTAIVTALLRLALGTGGNLIGTLLSLLSGFLLNAVLVKAVQDVRSGRVGLNLRETVNAALPFVGAVAIASILASIGIGIGFVLIIVPGLILGTFWSLIVPEIVIGGSGALESFGRSWRAVRGYAWKAFGVYVVLFLMALLVGGSDMVLKLVLPALPSVAQGFIFNVVPGTLLAPFFAIVVTLVYFRLTAAHGEPAEPGQGSAGGFGQDDGGFPPGGGYGETLLQGLTAWRASAPG